MLHKALLFQENREGVRMLGEGVPTNPISRMLRIGLWCTAGLAEKGQGVQERVDSEGSCPLKLLLRSPRARVGVCWQSRLYLERGGAEQQGGAQEHGSELRGYS